MAKGIERGATTPSGDDRIREASAALVEARARLLFVLDEECPGEHVARQHRDMQPPWCSACGYDNNGVRRRDARP